MFSVVLGEMGWIPKHVWCKVLCCIFYLYSPTNRAYIRPSSQDPNVYTFILGGPDVDCDKIMSNNEELVKTFYSVTKRTDIIFGDIVWISKYRSERASLFIYYLS